MKIYFGPDVDDLIRELRGQTASSVRLHVLHTIERKNLLMKVFVTALCNEQLFESVIEKTESLDEVPEDEIGEFVRDRCEEARSTIAERLESFEVKPGIFRE